MSILPIIILNYNTSSDCRKCVSFLKKQKGVELEIIIVDNCSCEEDLAELRILCEEQQCTLIENKENRGYNAGNNVGLRYVANKGYEFTLIANPDMEFPQTDYITHLISTISQDTNIVIAGSDIMHIGGFHQNPVEPDEKWHQFLGWLKRIFKNNNREYTRDYHISRYCEKLAGCCFLARMSFICNIEYFDENVFLYCEEAILAKQVKNAGKKMYYTAETKAFHRHIKERKDNPKVQLKYWTQSRMYYERTYNCKTRWQFLIAKFAWDTKCFFIILKSYIK